MHQREDGPDQSSDSTKIICDYLYYEQYWCMGQGKGTRSAALSVFCLLPFHENSSQHYVSGPIIMLYCLFGWLLFSLSYCCLWILIFLEKSSTLKALTTWKMEAEVIQLPSWVSFSVFIIVTHKVFTYYPCLSSASLFFFSGQVQKTYSCDLNFQVCW